VLVFGNNKLIQSREASGALFVGRLVFDTFPLPCSGCGPGDFHQKFTINLDFVIRVATTFTTSGMEILEASYQSNYGIFSLLS
jgi:hypothetical protein